MNRFIKFLLILCPLTFQIACTKEEPKAVVRHYNFDAKCFSGGVIIYEHERVDYHRLMDGGTLVFESDGTERDIDGDCVFSYTPKPK